MLLTPPPLCRQQGFNQINENENEIENLEELQVLDLNETIYRELHLNETIYRELHSSRKANSNSNLEELNKTPLIKKFNSF